MTKPGWKKATVKLGSVERLSNFSAVLEPGTITGLIGPNGAGKTTAIRALAGLVELSSGAVILPGDDEASTAYLPQSRPIAWNLEVRDVVAIGLTAGRQVFAQLSTDRQKAVLQGLKQADASTLASRNMLELSGGEQARVHLARLFATSAPLLILDEPLTGLDPAHQIDVLDGLAAQAQAGRTVLIAMHDLSAAECYCDRLLVLENGSGIADLSPAQIPEDILAKVFGLTRAAGELFVRSARMSPAP